MSLSFESKKSAYRVGELLETLADVENRSSVDVADVSLRLYQVKLTVVLNI